jgi:sporulation protein YlmC with PRC-barrel domain
MGRKQEITMLRSTVTMIAVATALGSLPVTAQQARPDTAQQETSVIGLPIYSSDGEKLGEVTQVGMHEGQQAVVAQLEPSVGKGAKVLIPAEMMTQQGDRLELPMTAEEVKKTVSKP